MMSRAISLALANPVKGLPRMAAVIADGKRVVSIGLNSRKTHPLAARYGRNPEALCIHAEIAAIASARESVDGMTMYIARVRKDGHPALAKPCIGCAMALAAFGISDVHFTVD